MAKRTSKSSGGDAAKIIIAIFSLFVGIVTILFKLITSLLGSQKSATNTESASTNLANNSPQSSGDSYDDPAVQIIRATIRAEVEKHKPAVGILQALARIDGNTSDAERSIVFDFLKRQGAPLDHTHREWFYTSRAGEWYRAAENEYIDAMIDSLKEKPLQYRVDICAAATAIVATGGTPKKREAETLEKIRSLIAT